jgi:hypothetical protein
VTFLRSDLADILRHHDETEQLRPLRHDTADHCPAFPFASIREYATAYIAPVIEGNG